MVRHCKISSWKVIVNFKIRTDNAIKNHFYSKLRKFIRKILKQINKEGLLKANSIDPVKFNSDKVYKMIKKNKLPYNSLNKDTIMTMIINYEKYSKGTKNDALLSKKTKRKSSAKIKTKKEKEKENYSEITNKAERTDQIERIDKSSSRKRGITIGLSNNKISTSNITTRKKDNIRINLTTNNGNDINLTTSATIKGTKSKSERNLQTEIQTSTRKKNSNLPYSLYSTTVNTRNRKSRKQESRRDIYTNCKFLQYLINL